MGGYQSLLEKKSTTAYQIVKNLTSEKQSRSTTIQDKSGKCFTDERDSIFVKTLRISACCLQG